MWRCVLMCVADDGRFHGLPDEVTAVQVELDKIGNAALPACLPHGLTDYLSDR